MHFPDQFCIPFKWPFLGYVAHYQITCFSSSLMVLSPVDRETEINSSVVRSWDHVQWRSLSHSNTMDSWALFH